MPNGKEYLYPYKDPEAYGDYGLNEYLEITKRYLREQRAAGKIDEEAEKEWLKYVRDLINQQTFVSALPYWYEFKKTWVTEVGGKLVLGGKALQTKSGQLYNLEGTAYDPTDAQQILKKYQEGFAPDEISPADKESIRLAEARLAEDIRQANMTQQRWEREQGETRRWREEQMGLERSRLAAETEETRGGQWRREQELQFELQRERTVAGLEGPADWIARWNAQKMPNPYTQPNQPMGTAAWGQMMQQAAQRNLQSATAMSTEAARALSQGKTDWFNQLSTSAYNLLKTSTSQQKSYEQAKAIADKEARAAGGIPIEKGGAVPAMAGGAMIKGGFYMPAGGTAATQPQTPPAPAWLSQFVPGQEAGEPISREFIPTPSPQTMNVAPWSVREGLRGYATWAGGRPYEDIIGEMQSMLPATPRGAGYPRWTPRRQWS